MHSPPPFDRQVALSASARTLRRLFIEAKCDCGRRNVAAIRQLLEARPDWSYRSVADLALSLVCDRCQARPKHINLAGNAFASSPVAGEPVSWTIPLIEP